MEQNFKVKFDSKEAYQKGVSEFMALLSTWKDNEEGFNRDYNIEPDVDEIENKFNINVNVEVTEKV